MAVQIKEDIRMFTQIHKSMSFDGVRDCSPAAALVALCFKASMKVHFAHLKTNSYSEHKAFQTFYEEITELGDKFAETYQGRFGVIDDYPHLRLHTHCGKHVIEVVAEWVEENRCAFDDELDLQTILSDILVLCNKTLYHISNLK